MKYLLLLLFMPVVSCQSKKSQLVNKDWILRYMSTVDSSRLYNESEAKMEFRFNEDGSFYYAENGIPKGDANTYELEGDKLALHWNGVYVEKMNTLTIHKIDTSGLSLINPNTNGLGASSFIFFQRGSIFFNYLKK